MEDMEGVEHTGVQQHEAGSSFDMITELPSEMALHVFRFLDRPRDLAIAAQVSHVWHGFAFQGTLWKTLCAQRWSDKQYKTIEATLRQEHERLRHQGEAEATRRKASVLSKSGSWLDWKEKLHEAEVDALRDIINKEELCGVKWSFQFHNDIWVQAGDDEQHVYFPTFNTDGTYIHEGVGLGHMTWRFLDRTRTDKEDGTERQCRFVQVQQFPPLTVSRTSDWGWTMHNQYVIFRSYDEVLEAKKEAEFKKQQERETEKEMNEMTENHASSLSIKELKEKLRKWKVDTRDCFEKSDLIAKALEYVREYKEAKQQQQQQQEKKE